MSTAYNDIWIEHKLDMYWKHQDSVGSTDRRPFRTEILNFGYIWLNKITNKTNKNISFYNPWKDDIADVAAGHSESNRCRGYIPLQDSCSRRYEIKYCDKELEEKSIMEIGDDNFKGDWLICIQHNDGIKRDFWDIRPPEGRAFSEVELTISNSGYEIFSIHGKLWVKGFI